MNLISKRTLVEGRRDCCAVHQSSCGKDLVDQVSIESLYSDCYAHKVS